MPNFNICRDKKEALDVIDRTIDRYRSAGYPYEQICILTLKKESTSFLEGVERIGNHKIQLNRNDSGVFFTSARKFKGLESDIIIMDVDDTSLADDEGKMLFYVGSSRAKHQLEILFIGDDLMLNNTIKKISDKSFPNTRIGIARCLHVKPAVF